MNLQVNGTDDEPATCDRNYQTLHVARPVSILSLFSANKALYVLVHWAYTKPCFRCCHL